MIEKECISAEHSARNDISIPVVAPGSLAGNLYGAASPLSRFSRCPLMILIPWHRRTGHASSFQMHHSSEGRYNLVALGRLGILLSFDDDRLISVQTLADRKWMVALCTVDDFNVSGACATCPDGV